MQSAIECSFKDCFSVCEIANTKRRTEAAAWVNLSSGSAQTVYAGIAYFIKDWKYIQITIAVIPASYVFMYYFLPESPRYNFVMILFDVATCKDFY